MVAAEVTEVAAEARKARRDAEVASAVKETVNNPEV